MERDADDAAHEQIAAEEREPHVPPDAPEADALEQSTPASGDHDGPPTRISPEVPEADALEQTQDVGDDEDEYDR